MRLVVIISSVHVAGKSIGEENANDEEEEA
jgi:hypothetical protein